MRDLAFIGFIAGLLALGCKRPFLFVLAYIYCDTVSPQRLSYYLLNSIPLQMIVAGLAFGAWLLLDSKRGLRIAPRQILMALLLGWVFYTTANADLPVEALVKWDWAWKALAFAIFLPLTLRTRLRVEAVILFLVLSLGAIAIVGGIKTLLSGGGYGVLNLMVDNNSGLYEGSIVSTVAIAAIPLILWLARHGTIFPADWRVKAFAAGLVFACLLIPVGTEARTGLVCIGVLGLLMLRDVKRRMLYLGVIGAGALIALPLLPQSFTGRMELIQGYEQDSSATTRIAVWRWTWNYAKDNPLGGGFEAYRQNRLQVQTVAETGTGPLTIRREAQHADEGRAWHSAYFEMLGEQGFPGLILFLLIHGAGLFRMEVIRRRYRDAPPDKAWIAPLATALQHFQIIFLVGALFVAVAFQPFPLIVIAVQIGFDLLIARREKAGRRPGERFADVRPALSPA